MHFESMAARWL
jgi:hypothetical protein